MRDGWRRHGPVVVLYLLLTTVVLWPAVRHFSTRPMIGKGDSSIFYWAWWWMPEAAARGENPLSTTDIMYPVGADLSVTVTAPAVAVLTWPVRALLGPDAQVNFVQLSATVAAALAAYFLVLRVWESRGAAVIAGAAFAFTPYRFVHLGEHLNLINMAVLPLSLLLALRLLERPDRPRALALGGMGGFAFLVEPQLAVISAVGVGVLLLSRRGALRGHVRALLEAAGCAVLVSAPVWLPLAIGVLGGESTRAGTATELAVFSSSPFSWVLPPVTHPWFGALSEPEVLSSFSEGVAYPGLILIALAVAGASMGLTRRRGWVALAVVGIVLSLGPFLVVGHRRSGLPLPYIVLRELPFMDTMRVPGRFALLGVLGICVLAAGTLATLSKRHPHRKTAILVGVSLVLAVELMPGPLPSRDGGAPAPYEAIREDPGEGAVLDIPMQWSTGSKIVGAGEGDPNVAIFMAWATVHEKPYVGGSVSRYSDERVAQLTAIPVYRQILGLQGEAGFDEPATFGVDDLADLGIGYVVYHRDAPEPAVLDHLRSLDMPVLADDGTVLAWRVPEG